MGNHGGGGGFPMASGDGDAFLAASELAENLGAFLHGDAASDERLELASVGRNSGGIDDEVDMLGEEVGVVLIMHIDALGLEGGSEGAGGTVVARDGVAATVEEARQRAHTNASDA